MARYSIKHANGTIIYTGEPRYSGSFGNVSYIEFNEIASATPIAFVVGDYVDYTGGGRTGLRYKLYSLPQPTKSAVSGSYGGAFVYKNVQLYAATKDLEISPFTDLVPDDNLSHYTTLPNVDVYDDVYGIAERIQACLDFFYGEGHWDINVINVSSGELYNVLHEEKAFSLSDGTCLDALNEIYKIWRGIGWVHTVVSGVNTITIGRPNLQDSGNTTSTFIFGKGNGLTAIAKAYSTKELFANRIYVYGSERNMPSRWYNKLTPSIHGNESVYLPKLMLPLSDWRTTDGAKDPRKAYLEDAASIAAYGLKPKTIRFEGGDYDEIYPSIEGATAKNIRDAKTAAGDQTYVPSSSYTDSERMDLVKVGSTVSDDGIVDNNGARYSQIFTTNAYPMTVTNSVLDKQISGLIPITNFIPNQTITSTGKIKIDNSISGTITSSKLLTSIKFTIWVVVGGTKYAERDVALTQTDTGYSFSLPSYTFNCNATGSATINGKVEFTLSGEDSFTVSLSVNSGGTSSWSIAHTIAESFNVTLKQIGFDLSKQQATDSNGLATLSMKSGACGGREFTITKCVYQSATDDWKLTVTRLLDESLGEYFPNSRYQITSGDSFVLTGLMMPDLYVNMSMARLHDEAVKILNNIKTPKPIYTPDIDAKVLAESPETITEGMYMPISDTELTEGVTEYVLIDSITIDEGEYSIPTYKVTLRDEKREDFVSMITKQSKENDRALKNLAWNEKQVDSLNNDTEYAPSENVSLTILSDNLIFTYPDGTTTTDVVTLTAKTTGVDNPTYQWYYLSSETWVALSGATGQAYTVDPDSTIYFQEGECVEDFKVVVSGMSAQAQVVKIKGGDSALNAFLSNPSHIFPAGVEYAVASTDTVDILAYRGTTRVVPTIGSITGQISGKITASVATTQQGFHTMTVTVTSSLNNQSGVLTIPVTIDGTTINLKYSWALALKGEQGIQGNPGQDGTDGDDGADGYSICELRIYKRSNNGAPSDTPDACTYTFATDSLAPDGSGSMNGWQRSIPSTNPSYPCYVRTAYVKSNTATASVPTTAWSEASRITGDNGLMGKIMRGVNTFSSSGLPSGDNYQGLDDIDTSHIYYDVVEHSGTYYYCKVYMKGSTLAKNITPGTDPDVWVVATNYDFIATRVLLASNAHIDCLSGNAIYMKDGVTVYAGMQGGTGINFFAGGSNPQTAPFRVNHQGQVDASNLNITGGSINVNNSFKVSSAGALEATSATINGKIEATGDNFTYDSQTYSAKFHKGFWNIGNIVLQKLTSASSIAITAIDNIASSLYAWAISCNGAFSVSSKGTTLSTTNGGSTQVNSDGDININANGSGADISIKAPNGDIVIRRSGDTMDYGLAGCAKLSPSQSAAIIMRIVSCDQDDFDALQTKDPNTLYIVK